MNEYNYILNLEKTAFTKEQLLDENLPQIALAGRSNVGKSSLINSLANRKSLAKTSSTPGKTRSINYYSINNTKSFIVDLPGYGYAKCSQEERNSWAKLIGDYIRLTSGLRAMAVLLDSRLKPQILDMTLIDMATSYNIPIIPVLTKKDKCTKKELSMCIKQWSSILVNKKFIAVSSLKKEGFAELWQVFGSFLNLDSE